VPVFAAAAVASEGLIRQSSGDRYARHRPQADRCFADSSAEFT